MYEKSQHPGSSATRPSSAVRPNSATHKIHNYKQVSSTSNVDETLFGSSDLLQGADFAAPWESKKKTKRPLLWSPATSNTTQRPKTPLKRQYHKIKFKPSFCDENLFGPKPLGADWAAPWEKNEKKPPPLVFDTTFTTTRTHALPADTARDTARLDSHRPGSARPASSRPGSRSQQSTPAPRPPWK